MPRRRSKTASVLTAFEGDPVLSAGVEVRNAAGGLNEALGVEPVEYHKDDTVVVILECDVSKIRFYPVKDTDGWRRVHILTATNAAVVDKSLVEDVLEAQRIKIEEAKGISRLPFGGEDPVEAHNRGDHDDEAVEGCPECEAAK